MKQSFLKLSGKKFLTVAFISASVIFASSFTAKAGDPTTGIEILSSDKSSVQFAGSTQDALFFKVHVNNETGDRFLLTIKSEEGNVLFSESFKDTNFEKQFKLLTTDQASNRFYFTVNSSNKNLNETYVVSSKQRTIDDVTVNKL